MTQADRVHSTPPTNRLQTLKKINPWRHRCWRAVATMIPTAALATSPAIDPMFI